MNTSALNQGFAVCPICGKVNLCGELSQKITCQRCRHKFYGRKPRSLQVCLAWCLASIIMFIPANLLPIMTFATVAGSTESTVLEGVQALIQFGMYPVAIVVFVASFVVPIGKIIGLLVLVWGVKFHRNIKPKQRTQMFLLIEFLGPWSMLDVFVVTIMAATVSLGFLTYVEPGDGLTYFALMVIFTMFAAQSFDPRLIWDNHQYDRK